MYIYTHTYSHTHTYTLHIHIHTLIHTYTYIQTYAHTHTYTPTGALNEGALCQEFLRGDEYVEGGVHASGSRISSPEQGGDITLTGNRLY